MLVEKASQVNNTTKAATCADDLTATGTVICLRNCWDTFGRLRPKFDSFLEESK